MKTKALFVALFVVGCGEKITNNYITSVVDTEDMRDASAEAKSAMPAPASPDAGTLDLTVALVSDSGTSADSQVPTSPDTMPVRRDMVITGRAAHKDGVCRVPEQRKLFVGAWRNRPRGDGGSEVLSANDGSFQLIIPSGLFTEDESMFLTVGGSDSCSVVPFHSGGKINLNLTAQLGDTCSSVPEVCECTPGTERGCYSASADTKNVGRCHAGIQKCVVTDRGSSWEASCLGEVTPYPWGERCDDGVDDNCNGTVDDTCPVWLENNVVRLTTPDYDVSHMCGLDAANGRLVWVQGVTKGGFIDCTNYGGTLVRWDLGNPQDLRNFGTGTHLTSPTINEFGDVGYVLVDADRGCSYALTASASKLNNVKSVSNNCGTGKALLPQATTTKYRGGLFVFRMPKNDGTQNLETKFWDGNTVRMHPVLEGTFPAVHGLSLSFRRHQAAGVLDSVTGNELDVIVPSSADRIIAGLDFSKDSYLLLEYSNTDSTKSFIRLANRATKVGIELGTGWFDQPQINDAGTVAAWKTSYSTMRYVGNEGVQGTIEGIREFVLDGRDIYYIGTDGGGQDALFVYRVGVKQ